MAEQKVFAGPRIRRIRNALGLTQSAMAHEVGISPSYLNLIERNQRPLTVQLLLKLSATYDLNLEELQGEPQGSVAALKEVFADPLLSGELPGDQELFEISEAAPNAANGILKLYRAYRESQSRLSDLNDLLAQEGRATEALASMLPADVVQSAMEARPYHFPRIEEQAEAFAETLGSGVDRLRDLKEWLKREHNITVRSLPVETMPLWRRRFDKHSMRLFLSERLSPFDQLREVAMEACLLFMPEAIRAELIRLQLKSDEADRLARFELARYAAHALIMPYGRFLQMAERVRYDIDVLSGRFGVSFEQAANRLTMLSRNGHVGIPFFCMEMDHAGNIIRRQGSKGFPKSSFGGACPKLPIHAAFAQTGQVISETVVSPDGTEYQVVARTLEGPKTGFDERVRRTAILVGCERDVAGETVYGQNPTPRPTEIGASCRLCERQGCLSRAEPPITRPLGLDEMVAGLSVFDFQ
jgi:predicted transcriptional regulator/DNA-binding XRE family transcriptional regulator